MSATAVDIGYGITCIDANYVGEGIASFYLVEEDGEYAVIETGTRYSVDGLISLMEARDIASEQIRYVIPTHVHLDHAGGAGRMMSLFPAAELLIHPRGARHMIDPAKLESAARAVYGDAVFDQLYGEMIPVPAGRVRPRPPR